MAGFCSALVTFALVGEQRVVDDAQLLDGRDALEAVGGVGGAAADRQQEGDRAGLRGHDLEPGGLGDDRHLGHVAGPDRGQHAGAAVLLAGHGHQHRLALQLGLGVDQRPQRGQAGHHAALHVQRAAPVQAAVAQLRTERVGAPVLARPRRHRVDVAGDDHPARRADQADRARPPPAASCAAPPCPGSRGRRPAATGRRRRASPPARRAPSAGPPRSARRPPRR